jgi:tetratricopeptide (TPR) repeat protein
MVWAAAATLAVLAGTGVVYALRSGPGPAVRTQATPQTPKGVEPPNDADAEAGDDAQGRAEAPAHKAAAAPVPPQTEATTTPEPQAEQATKAQRPRVSRPATGVRGRLGRAWARAIGQGPGAAERARARAVTQLYSQALAQSRSADREGALATLQDLLAQDALHPAGRALQGQLLLHEDEANALRKAQTAMQAGQALEALGIVSQALDRPFHAAGAHGDRGQQTAPSTEAQELRALGDQAALQLGQACGERAQAACMAQAWEPCIVQLACFLGYQPQTVQGLALLTLAMDAVRGHALGQTPAKEGAPAPGQQPMVVAQEALGALTERYPQAALRQAVLVYSTGDIAAASQKLHPLTCRQCRVVGGDVRRVALGLPRAKQLRESGQHAAAQALYDEILAADSRLCPPPTPSVLHNLALEGKQAVFLLQGSAAFERGAYKEALSAYLAGIRLGLSNDGLQEAVARLSRRAQDIFSSVQASVGKAGDSASLPAPVCSHLREVLDMTTAEDPTHKRAEGLLARCKGKH